MCVRLLLLLGWYEKQKCIANMNTALTQQLKSHHQFKQLEYKKKFVKWKRRGIEINKYEMSNRKNWSHRAMSMTQNQPENIEKRNMHTVNRVNERRALELGPEREKKLKIENTHERAHNDENEKLFGVFEESIRKKGNKQP